MPPAFLFGYAGNSERRTAINPIVPALGLLRRVSQKAARVHHIERTRWQLAP